MYKNPNECYKRRRRIIGRKRIKTLERVLTTINVMTTNNFWFNFLVSYYYIGMVQAVYSVEFLVFLDVRIYYKQTIIYIALERHVDERERLCVLCRQVLWENFFEHIMVLKELYILEYHKTTFTTLFWCFCFLYLVF